TNNLYPGNSSGGQSTDKQLKASSSSANGAMTLVFSSSDITKVVVYVKSWSSTANSGLNINSAGNQTFTGNTVHELTFEFSATNTLTFNFSSRVHVFKIEIFTGE